MEVLEAIKNRRTTRVPFKKGAVAEKDIDTLLDISNISPDGTPAAWRMVRINDDRVKDGLCRIIREDFGNFFQNDAGRFREIFSQYPKWLRFSDAEDGILLNRTPKAAGYFFRAAMGKTLGPLMGKLGIMNREISAYAANVLSSPVVFGVFLERRIEAGPPDMPSIWTAGAMLQNLRLTATDLGLCFQDLSWITATENGAEKARLLLNVPEEYAAANFFRIGHADNLNNQQKRSDFRRDLRDIVHEGEFGMRFSVPRAWRTSVEINDAIRGKRTEKRSGRITDEELGYLLEAARWTPTSFNAQPFEFIVGQRTDGTSIIVIEDKERDTPDPGPCKALVRGGLLQNIRLAGRALGLNCSFRKSRADEEKLLRKELSLPLNYSIMVIAEI